MFRSASRLGFSPDGCTISSDRRRRTHGTGTSSERLGVVVPSSSQDRVGSGAPEVCRVVPVESCLSSRFGCVGPGGPGARDSVETPPSLRAVVFVGYDTRRTDGVGDAPGSRAGFGSGTPQGSFDREGVRVSPRP